MVYAIIAIITALIVSAVAFLIVGIRVQGYFDLQTGTFVVDAFAFGHIHVFRYKAFECSGSFYSQINTRELKKVSLRQKKGSEYYADEKSENGVRHFAKKISVIAVALDLCPRITIKKLRAYLTVGAGDCMETSLAAASIAATLGALGAAMRDKIKVKQGDVAVFPNFRYENTVLTFDIDAGYGTLSLLSALLNVAIRMKKSQSEARSGAIER